MAPADHKQLERDLARATKRGKDRMREQSPDVHDVWSLRVGFRALHHFGGRPLPSTK